VSDSKKIIVALDKPTATKALELEALHKQGFEVFLDLKFHDIPNTVASAVQVAAGLGVWMLTLHAAGGERMMAAARDAADAAGGKAPMLVGVTVLTSMDQSELTTTGISHSVADQVQRLAGLAAKAGCNGIVCSAQEHRVFVWRVMMPLTSGV